METIEVKIQEIFKVYLHIKSTNGEPFYVGKGKGNRAFDFKKSRSTMWNNVSKKYGVDVIILEDNLTNKAACELEIYWIKRIGRRDLNEGTLVNHSDGGEGVVNWSDDMKNRVSKSHTGRIHTAKSRQNMKNGQIKRFQNNPSNRKNTKLSQETIQRISDSKKGKNLKIILDCYNGVFYTSDELITLLDMNLSKFYRIINKKQRYSFV